MPEQKPRTPLRAERLKALKDAAADMCGYCHGDEQGVEAIPYWNQRWRHRMPAMPDARGPICGSAPIWSRIWFEYNKEEYKPE